MTNTFKSITEIIENNQQNGISNGAISEVLAKTGLAGWDVRQTPVLYRAVTPDNLAGDERVLAGSYVTYRGDNGRPFPCIVKSRYTITQNEEGFKFLEALPELSSLTGGELVSGCYLMGTFGEIDLFGEKIRNYVFFTNSFDGSSRFIVALTPIRVCDNSVLNIASNAGMFGLGIKHTPSIADRLVLAQNILRQQQAANQGLIETATKARAVVIPHEKLDLLVADILDAGIPQRVKGVKNTISPKTIEAIVALYRESDIVKYSGTGYGLILAFAKYVNQFVIAQAINKERALFNNCLLNPNPLVAMAVRKILAYQP